MENPFEPPDAYILPAENQVGGRDFRSLTDRYLKDLIPAFTLSKRLREWVESLVSDNISWFYCFPCRPQHYYIFTFSTHHLLYLFIIKTSGERKLIKRKECDGSSDGRCQESLDKSLDTDDNITHVEESVNGNVTDNEPEVLRNLFWNI